MALIIAVTSFSLAGTCCTCGDPRRDRIASTPRGRRARNTGCQPSQKPTILLVAALVLVVSGIVAIAGAGNYSSKMEKFLEVFEKEDEIKADISTCNAGCALSVVGGVFAFLTGVERPRQKPGRRRGYNTEVTPRPHRGVAARGPTDDPRPCRGVAARAPRTVCAAASPRAPRTVVNSPLMSD